MKKKLSLILAACALLLTGCALVDRDSCRQCALEGFDPRVVRPPNPLLPNVFVIDRQYLVVDQEPIRISKRDVGQNGLITISWALAAGTPYVFVDKIGIAFAPPIGAVPPTKKIDAPAELDCNVRGEQRKIFVCSFRPLPGQSYKYTVSVVNRENPREVIERLDPFIASGH